MEGTPFGRYRLIELLGRGGMGEVWRAYDTAIDRMVALKMLLPHYTQDQTYKQRFWREARAAARLDDPHVVPIYDVGEQDERLYLTMRLINGEDLQTRLDGGRLDPELAVRIVDQVAGALDAAHDVGLVHRDIKPKNILLDGKDFAYLIDFGIVRAIGEARLTSTGFTVGTWSYMAPERFRAGEVGPSSDIYALACVLYQCLTGELPFPGSTFEQVAMAHVSAPPPKPSISGNAIPIAMDDVIAVGLAKNPDRRYPTALELAAAAKAVLTRPISAPSADARTSDVVEPAPQNSVLPANRAGRAPSPQPDDLTLAAFALDEDIDRRLAAGKAKEPPTKKPTEPVASRADDGVKRQAPQRNFAAAAAGIIGIAVVAVIIGVLAETVSGGPQRDSSNAVTTTTTPSPQLFMPPTSTTPEPPVDPLTALHQVEGVTDKWLLDGLHVASTPHWNDATDGQWECGAKLEGTSRYCADSASVYIPVTAVQGWSSNQSLGAAYVTGVHATHHLQHLAGGATGETAAAENQAACGAGVFIKWAMDNGSLKITPDEVSALESAMRSVPSDDIFNSDALAAALDSGFKSGSLGTCVPIAGPLAGA